LKIHKKIEKNNTDTHCSLPVLSGAAAEPERTKNKNTLFFKFSAGYEVHCDAATAREAALSNLAACAEKHMLNKNK
jgi:hypothetical protein